MSATEAGKTEAPQGETSTIAQHAVFISCAPEDQELAETVSTHLKNRGLSSWYPLRDLREGADEEAQVDEAIRSSKAMVVVFTDAANASKNVLREASVAIGCDIELVPFKLTRTLPVMGLEYYLSTVPWVDGTHEPLDTSAKGLAAAVAELIGEPTRENKLTALWKAAKTSDDMKNMPEMGVPVTIVVPEQGSWESVEPVADAHETAMVTDGVPVTIVYPEDGSWELKDESSAAAEAGSADAPAKETATEEPTADEVTAAEPEPDGDSEEGQEEVTASKLEEELFSTSVAAAERLREMTKKDADPAPLGDMIKVVLALLLAGAALIYMLVTSSMG